MAAPLDVEAARILIVDDHEDNVELLRARLESWGYIPDAASNGADALRKIDESPPDLILLDAPTLPAAQRSQVETIRNMTMRLNEIVRRFSSLQKEMQLIEQQTKKKPVEKSATAGA